MNGASKTHQQHHHHHQQHQQQAAASQQYPYNMYGLNDQDGLFPSIDANQDLFFGTVDNQVYPGMSPPISPPNTQQQAVSGMPASQPLTSHSLYTTGNPYMTNQNNMGPGGDGLVNNDGLEFINTNGSFDTQTSPIMNTAGFDGGYSEFDNSYDWGADGLGTSVIMGDAGLADPLAFNDPLDEGLIDPLEDQSFQESLTSETPNKATTSKAEKRKSLNAPEGSTDPPVSEPKKRGRKRITSEPSSKRKAQNRAAQRAFRERKEKHVRDLEQKVAELEKASESTNTENNLLRQKVDHLQTELKQYRKRLHSISRANMALSGNNFPGGPFQFDFPPWGNNVKPPSPADSNKNSNNNTLMTRQKSEDKHLSSGSEKGEATSVESPADSSAASKNFTSSCATSPEPTISPLTPPVSELKITQNGDLVSCETTEDGESFCMKLNSIACSRPTTQSPDGPDFERIKQLKQQALDQLYARSRSRSASQTPSISKLSAENGGNFNPSFGSYREPVDRTNSSVLESDPRETVFTDLSKLNSLKQFRKPKELIDSEEEEDGGDDLGTEKLMTCAKIWDRISAHPSFKSGELDVDGLCTELKQKAKCSEGNVVIGERHLEKALKKLEQESASRKGSPSAA